MSKYYTIVSLKEKQYLEYKYKKQEYLLKIDYETVSSFKKETLKDKYNDFYISKMNELYKGLLKNYSIQLSDNVTSKLEATDSTYDKIFTALENYITEVLPIKIKKDKSNDLKNVVEEYDRYEQVTIGKLDDLDIIKKKMVLLAISRQLFTHSLPLIAAEQCYIKLIKTTRDIIETSTNKIKKERAYNTLIELIEDYNIKLLSTKVYWDKPEGREEYKKFWDKYKSLENLQAEEKHKQKEILFLKYDIKKLNSSKKDYSKIIKTLKGKLVELGAMRQFKNSYISIGNYKKEKIKENIV